MQEYFLCTVSDYSVFLVPTVTLQMRNNAVQYDMESTVLSVKNLPHP